MATPAEDDYDKLTPEQREIRDKEDRAREVEEQASTYKLQEHIVSSSLVVDQYSIAVHLEARTG
jgi:hypothetical protein